MPALTFNDIFGSNVQLIDGGNASWQLAIQVSDFLGQSVGGDLPDDKAVGNTYGVTPVQIFYGLILFILQNQAAQINGDPEQKIHITQSAKSIATGTRDGQVRRSFTVNFFTEAGLAGTSGIDAVDTRVFESLAYVV